MFRIVNTEIKYVVDATGLNMKAFDEYTVIGYQPDTLRWRSSYSKGLFNQEFNLDIDLNLLDTSNPSIKSITGIFFNIEDSSILGGVKVSGKSLESWCKLLKQEVACIILRLPKNYNLMLKDYAVDTSGQFDLVYITTHTLNSESLTIVNKNEEDELKEIENMSIEPSKLTHLQGLVGIPPPVSVKTTKTILKTFLGTDFPIRKYVSEYLNPKAIHIGQRKLHLCEVEFLTRVAKASSKQYSVIYAGNAGVHLYTLAEMFPEMLFKLYDSSGNLKSGKNITVIDKEFSSEIASTIKDENILFICDVRHKADGYELEKLVLKDLEDQRVWVGIMKPKRSLLKFRLPFTEDENATTKHFDGVIHFQPFSPPQSAETRLEIGNDPAVINYSNRLYEQQMFYFNTVYRIQNFYHYNTVYGWSFDTIREFFILKKYCDYKGINYSNISKYSIEFDKFTNKKEKSVANILKVK